MGSGCYMNFNCCFLDCAPIKIGKDVRPAILFLFWIILTGCMIPLLGFTPWHDQNFTANDRIAVQVLMGPMVQLYPPAHPLDPSVRDGLRGPEYARGITIGDNVWIGGSAIILGERSSVLRNSNTLKRPVISRLSLQGAFVPVSTEVLHGHCQRRWLQNAFSSFSVCFTVACPPWNLTLSD